MRAFTVFTLLVWCCFMPLLANGAPSTENTENTENRENTEKEPLVLAILEFDAVNEEARASNKGRIISEIFTTAAVQSGMQVVERHMIRKVMDEMEFGDSAFSGTAAQKIGVMLGANAVLTGSVSEFMGALRIDARLINVTDGAIVLADGAQAELELADIIAAVEGLIGKMVAALRGEQDSQTPLAVQDGAPSAVQDVQSLLQPVSVLASSSLPSSKNRNYQPENLIDGSHATVWVEGAQDNGKGQWVKFVFQGQPLISRIALVNGYNRVDAGSGGDRWLQNGRVKKLQLTFADGTSRTITLQDSRKRQEVTFPPVRSETLVLTILESYLGVKWPNDTCLAEVFVYGAP